MARGTNIKSLTKQYRTPTKGDLPDELTIHLVRERKAKYGENPNQAGGIYVISGLAAKTVDTLAKLTNLVPVRFDGRGKGGLSLTNTLDITRGMSSLTFFEPKDPGDADVEAVAMLKHTIVSGFAMETKGESQTALFRAARDCDRQSNFGGTAVFNRPVTMETADAIFELYDANPRFFIDVVAAPGYEEGVLHRLEQGAKDIRFGEFANLGSLPKFVGDDTHGLLSFKEMPTGRLGVQDLYLTDIRSVDDLVLDPMIEREGVPHVIKRDPTTQEGKDMLTAWYLNIAGARSNGVVFVRRGRLVAMGSGQVERVGAAVQAVIKGTQKAMDREGIKYNPLYGIMGSHMLRDNPFDGAVCASDGFFPFGDTVDLLGKMGVTAAVQPYGSRRDWEVIDAANHHKMALPASRIRCFGHF